MRQIIRFTLLGFDSLKSALICSLCCAVICFDQSSSWRFRVYSSQLSFHLGYSLLDLHCFACMIDSGIQTSLTCVMPLRVSPSPLLWLFAVIFFWLCYLCRIWITNGQSTTPGSGSLRTLQYPLGATFHQARSSIYASCSFRLEVPPRAHISSAVLLQLERFDDRFSPGHSPWLLKLHQVLTLACAPLRA